MAPVEVFFQEAERGPPYCCETVAGWLSRPERFTRLARNDFERYRAFNRRPRERELVRVRKQTRDRPAGFVSMFFRLFVEERRERTCVFCAIASGTLSRDPVNRFLPMVSRFRNRSPRERECIVNVRFADRAKRNGEQTIPLRGLESRQGSRN